MKKSSPKSEHNQLPAESEKVSHKKFLIRAALVIGFLAIAAVAFNIGMKAAVETQSLWQTVEVDSSELNCAGDFLLMYDYSSADSAEEAYRELVSIYSRACEEAYQIFAPDYLADGVLNLGYLNAHPNETVTVDAELYDALELVNQYGSRYLFLGPACEQYDRIFYSVDEADARENTAEGSAEIGSYLAAIAAFAADKSAAAVELLGENQVKLTVSQEYLQFLEENEISCILDFGWMKNAFIADYLASVLQTAGYTCGYLSSYDGFTRNLDSRGMSYTYSLYNLVGSTAYVAARLTYDTPTAFAFLRSYPLSQLDQPHYYTFSSGTILTSYLDISDGTDRTACANIVGYSYGGSCAELALRLAPVYIADTLDTGALDALADEGIYSVRDEDGTLVCNEPDKSLDYASSPDSDA